MARLPHVAPNLMPSPTPVGLRASAAMASHPLLTPAASPVLGSRASLYVGDLDRVVAEGQLFMLFSQVAPVASLRVCRDIAGRSLGYGYVNFHSREDAKRALETLNFVLVNGKSIRVMFSNRDPMLRNNGKANVFIKNLESDIDNKALNDIFSGFGTILSCKVATNLSGHSKGYGFVQFEDEKSAKDAINGLNGKLSNGKILFVGLFIRRQDRQHICVMRKFTNVYIKNFPTEFTEDDLHQEFAPFGDITSAIVMKDADGKSKCFGFVNYEKPEYATEAIRIINGKMVKGTILYVARAQKKAERQAELKAKFERERTEKLKKFEGLNLYIKNLDDSINDRVHQNVNQNITYLANVRNGPTNDAMAILDFVTPIVARSLAPTDPTGPGTYTLERSTVTADQEKQHQTLVEQLEPEFTEKVTKILLELEKTEVLHLIESANDLREKVCQAMEALRCRKAEDASEADNVTCTLLSSSSSKDSTSLVF
uniref:Uncharacterized protein n=1 Tax=Avena sativa TaxID=4498 RepID=A0ACD6AHE5_AVESA